jgi:hypothetical protein
MVGGGLHSLMTPSIVAVSVETGPPYCHASWFADNVPHDLIIMFLEDNMCIIMDDKVYMDVVKSVHDKWNIQGENCYVEIHINPIDIYIVTPDNTYVFKEGENCLIINNNTYPVTINRTKTETEQNYYKTVSYVSFYDIGSCSIMMTLPIEKTHVSQVLIPAGAILLVVGIVMLRRGYVAT